MKLAIYGSGGLGREIFDSANRLSRWDEIFFINDFQRDDYLGARVFSFEEFCNDHINDSEVIIAVGEPKARDFLYKKVKEKGIKLASVISNNAIISPSVIIENGCYISDFCYIDSHATISESCCILPHSIIGHNTFLDKNVMVCAHCVVLSDINIDKNVFIGAGALIKNHLNIKSDSIVSMGAVVMSDVSEGKTVIGNPARATLTSNNQRVFK